MSDGAKQEEFLKLIVNLEEGRARVPAAKGMAATGAPAKAAATKRATARPSEIEINFRGAALQVNDRLRGIENYWEWRQRVMDGVGAVLRGEMLLALLKSKPAAVWDEAEKEVDEEGILRTVSEDPDKDGLARHDLARMDKQLKAYLTSTLSSIPLNQVLSETTAHGVWLVLMSRHHNESHEFCYALYGGLAAMWCNEWAGIVKHLDAFEHDLCILRHSDKTGEYTVPRALATTLSMGLGDVFEDDRKREGFAAMTVEEISQCLRNLAKNKQLRKRGDGRGAAAEGAGSSAPVAAAAVGGAAYALAGGGGGGMKRRQVKPDTRCWVCDQPGHVSFMCPNKKGTQPQRGGSEAKQQQKGDDEKKKKKKKDKKGKKKQGSGSGSGVTFVVTGVALGAQSQYGSHWLLDSAASEHYTPYAADLHDSRALVPDEVHVWAADGKRLSATHVGNATIQVRTADGGTLTTTLTKVYAVPGLYQRLASVASLVGRGYHVSFGSQEAQVYKGKKVCCVAPHRRGVWVFGKAVGEGAGAAVSGRPAVAEDGAAAAAVQGPAEAGSSSSTSSAAASSSAGYTATTSSGTARDTLTLYAKRGKDLAAAARKQAAGVGKRIAAAATQAVAGVGKAPVAAAQQAAAGVGKAPVAAAQKKDFAQGKGGGVPLSSSGCGTADTPTSTAL